MSDFRFVVRDMEEWTIGVIKFVRRLSACSPANDFDIELGSAQPEMVNRVDCSMTSCFESRWSVTALAVDCRLEKIHVDCWRIFICRMGVSVMLLLQPISTKWNFRVVIFSFSGPFAIFHWEHRGLLVRLPLPSKSLKLRQLPGFYWDGIWWIVIWIFCFFGFGEYDKHRTELVCILVG